MVLAAIHGKMPSGHSEDLLTADVFSVFRYLPSDQGIIGFVRSIPGMEDRIPSPDKDSTCEIHLWPRVTGRRREPDVLLLLTVKGRRYDIVIEAKVGTGRITEGATRDNQLATEYQDLLNGSYTLLRGTARNRPIQLDSDPENRFLLYLTGHTVRPEGELAQSVNCFPAMKGKLFWASWPMVYGYLAAIKDRLDAFPYGRIITDLLHLLKKKGLSPFLGVTRPPAMAATVISGRFWGKRDAGDESAQVENDRGARVMTTSELYKQIIGYVDDLHRDIDQFDRVVRKEMSEQGYGSLPIMGRRISWSLSNASRRPQRWRLSHSFRFFVPGHVRESESSRKLEGCAFYLLDLKADSDLDFPVLICGVLSHRPISQREIRSRIVQEYHRLRTVAYSGSQWKPVRNEKGWCIVEPSFKSPIKEFRGYLLNLFDMDSRQAVLENLVRPLASGGEVDLDAALTVTKYDFTGMGAE